MADSKRSFYPSDVPEKQDDNHGSCHFERTRPDINAKGVESVNIELTFAEALRLSTAIQSAVMRLNRYSRSTTKGKEMGMCLSVKVPTRIIHVIETRVRKSQDVAE